MIQSIFQAVQAGDLDAVRYYLAHECNLDEVDEQGWTALHYAAEGGFLDIVDVLLQQGASLEVRNPAGYTPLQVMMICEQYSLALAHLFLSAGADAGSPLHRAVLLGDVALLRQLLKEIDVNVRDAIGNAPLHLAVASNQRSMVELLLQYGADVNAQDEHDTTSLVEAAAQGFEPIISVLLQAGALVELRDYNGRVPLIFAVGNDHYSAALQLLAAGAKINVQDHFGNTPLHYAYENELFNHVKMLLDRGANDLLKNEEGACPIDLLPS